MRRERYFSRHGIAFLLTGALTAKSYVSSNSVDHRHDIPPNNKKAMDQYPIGNDPTKGSRSYLSATTETFFSSVSTDKANRLPNQEESSFTDSGTETNPSSSSSSLSPCLPEKDGYFGATFGEPVTLQYGFELTSYHDAEITEALTTISNLLVQNVISNTFPTICSENHRRRNQWNDSNEPASAGIAGISANDNLSGKVRGFKFELDFELDVSEPCVSFSETTEFTCDVYIGFLAVYGNNLADGATARVLENVKTAVGGTLSRAAAYGVTNIVAIDKFFTNVEESTSGPNIFDGREKPEENTIANETASIGVKFGLAISGVFFCAGLVILSMYVWIDIQFRREKLRRSRYTGLGTYDTPLSPVKETRIVGSKPRNNPETTYWGPSGFRRSKNSCADTCNQSTHIGDESQATSTIYSASVGLGSTLPSQRSRRNFESCRQPVLLEFDPGFDPPLGHPESTEDEKDDDDYSTDDTEDDTASNNTSIADLSNIDESILVTNMRRQVRRYDGNQQTG